MVVDTQAILNLVVIVGSDSGVNRNIKETAKGAAAIGVGAFLGGLLGGPPGMFIGGILSSAATYFSKKDDFVSLKEAIDHMPPREQQLLAEEMNSFINQLEVNDIAILTAMCLETINSGGIPALMRNPMLNSLRENAIRVVSDQLRHY